ncbi:long-chain-fatty-acid--CoA ligase [Candidatus Woesearchaeota archaeon]|nr:long-chain-fatty-acid--CoA ligase [Candidatus Woesearchaeota archaeon]
MTLVSSFNKTFEAYKGKAAIEFDNNEVTFDEVNKRANEVANALSKAGIGKGDRVAIFLSNSMELVYFFVGALKNGSIVVPMNISFKGMEVKYMLNDSGAKAVLTDKETLPIIKNVLPELKGLKHIITAGCSEFTDFNDFISGASDGEPGVEINGEDGSIIFYTSGTTGRSKGALLSHRNMESDLDALKEAWRLTDKDRLLLALPLYHIHGLGVALCGSFYNGYSLVLRKRFDAEETLKLIQDKKCTLFMGVPTMYIKILEVNEKYDTSSMRLFISGSAPLSAETFKEFKEKFGHNILERAGMSETNMNFSNPYHGKRKPGTVGLPLKGVKVKIVGKNFREVPKGREGDILIKGPNVFKGYWNAPEKTKESFHDGWFITGDVGKIDNDGYITFLGRSKDLIISGGLNIYPAEVEEVVNSHPAVLESAIIGVPDKYFGEAVKVFVVLKKGKKAAEEEIIAYCKEKLASYKKPKYVEFIDALPKNSMGKVQKNVLREREASK